MASILLIDDDASLHNLLGKVWSSKATLCFMPMTGVKDFACCLRNGPISLSSM